MSDLSEEIEAQRARSRRTARMTRKDRRALRRGKGSAGGVTVSCGCRVARTGGEWQRVWPCRAHEVGAVTDAEMLLLGTAS